VNVCKHYFGKLLLQGDVLHQEDNMVSYP